MLIMHQPMTIQVIFLQIYFKTEGTPLGSEDIKHGQKAMFSGTLSLMCDEQDPMFMTFQHPKICIIYHSNESTSEVFAEQEKMCVDGILGLFTYGCHLWEMKRDLIQQEFHPFVSSVEVAQLFVFKGQFPYH